MSTLEKAIALAATAHAGQHDKGGEPYILHPIRVMLRVKGDYARMAAVLHDVVEDTAITFDQLALEGFPEAVMEAIRALTKFPGESRLQAAARAACNPIAPQVKLADIADNMDMTRIPNPTDKDIARQREYAAVRDLLVSSGDA